MSQKHFNQLIKELCQNNAIDDPSAIVAGMPIIIGNIRVSLVYEEMINPKCLLVYCDFGPLPKGKEADAMRALLSNNLYLYNGRGPSFGFSREDAHVLLIDQFPLDPTDADGLHRLMSYHAKQATQWQQTHFLEPLGAVTSSPHNTSLESHDIIFNSLAGKL